MRCNDGLADHGRWGPAAADSFQPLTCPAFHSWQLTEKPSHTKSLGMGSGVALLLGPPAGPLQLLGGRPLLWPLHPSSTCPRGHGWGFEATPVSSITGSLTGALSCVRLLLPRPPAGRGILTHVLSICCPQSPWGTAAAQCTAGGPHVPPTSPTAHRRVQKPHSVHRCERAPAWPARPPAPPRRMPTLSFPRGGQAPLRHPAILTTFGPEERTAPASAELRIHQPHSSRVPVTSTNPGVKTMARTSCAPTVTAWELRN